MLCYAFLCLVVVVYSSFVCDVTCCCVVLCIVLCYTGVRGSCVCSVSCCVVLSCVGIMLRRG